MKDDVLKNFSSPNGEIRLLFATEAYSMGTDVEDIRRIIHLGVPSSLESKICTNTVTQHFTVIIHMLSINKNNKIIRIIK